MHLNTLDFPNVGVTGPKRIENGLTHTVRGFERLAKLRVEREQNKLFNFDILMANPPFAGDIKESRLLHEYHLAFKANGVPQTKVGRDILFIERNLDFPQTWWTHGNCPAAGQIQQHCRTNISAILFLNHARILAVVGLHGQHLQAPHRHQNQRTVPTEMGVMSFVPKVKDDYPIFFAVSEKGGKDNSGDYVYLKNEDAKDKLDRNGHLIVDHDLHSHNGELPDGIAEAFIEWAKDEKLSFWRHDE